jgi:peptidoglycan/LPS O-acetylase OafA/YrhL
MFLYLLFPYFLIVSGKSPRIAIAGIIIAIITSLNVYLEKSDPVYANPVFRLADFTCGIGFYFALRNIGPNRYLHLLVLSLLLFISVYLGDGKYRYMLGQFIIIPLFGLWIALVHHSSSFIYNNRMLEYLGLISYSFYLWQFAAIELGKNIIAWFPWASLHLVVLAAFIVNVCVSALSYHLVEERARKWVLRRFGGAGLASNSSTAPTC